jgi:hypothetical protein
MGITHIERMSDVYITARDERRKGEDNDVDIPVTHIMYMEGLKDAGTRLYVLCHGREVRQFVCSMKIGKVMKRCMGLPFVKIQKGWTINMNFLLATGGDNVYLTTFLLDKDGELFRIALKFGGEDKRKEFDEYRWKHGFNGHLFPPVFFPQYPSMVRVIFIKEEEEI